ncbi:hypothetical protein HanPI659440_Chr13g0508811 [Helianthus annuus]|nr:hypothetical protein HanPI659440_Chr13g0508811 [Helianthus annuus]
MAISNLHIILHSFLFALILTQITAHVTGDGVSPGSGESESFPTEFDKLSAKIQSLESLVDKKSEESRTKDEIITEKEKEVVEKEKTIKEKSESMDSLQNEVASLKVKGSTDTDEAVEKAHTRSQELEKQVEKLELDLELKAGLMQDLETRSKELEKNLLEMNPKLQNLQQTIEEQKTKLQKTERALKYAEEELTKTKNEATQKIGELTEVHSAWLPVWLVAYLSSTKSYVVARWNEHAQPVFDKFTKKAETLAEPHVDTAKSKWIPAAKEQWMIVKTNVETRVQLLTKKTKEVYARSTEALTPHVTKVKEIVNPHFQVAKKFCEPYIDQVAVATKPHLDKARDTAKPYTNKVVQVYSKFLESASKYHQQVQGTVGESLKKHVITRTLATKEFVWFIASAVLALPIFILFKALSAIFIGTAKKPTKTSKPSHTRRKAKRAH